MKIFKKFLNDFKLFLNYNKFKIKDYQYDYN